MRQLLRVIHRSLMSIVGARPAAAEALSVAAFQTQRINREFITQSAPVSAQPYDPECKEPSMSHLPESATGK